MGSRRNQHYTLGSWGWMMDGEEKVYRAPVYERSNNSLAYWIEVRADRVVKSVPLYRVSVLRGEERVESVLKAELAKAREWAARWVEELEGEEEVA